MRASRYTANLLKAMAHPVRIAILELLHQDGESCVCHLEHALGQRQAYISQQLARLRDANLVVDRRQGLNVFYALSDMHMKSLLDSIERVVHIQAELEGCELEFGMIDPDRHASCPCPKCADALVEQDRVLEEKR